MFYSKSTHGFYSTEIHGSNMPEDVVEIDTEHYNSLLAGQSLGAEISSDETGNPILIWPAPLTTQQLIQRQKMRINFDFELAMQQITAGYPKSEIDSWSKQEAEARAYVADAEAVTPLIDALALGRGLSKADLASRILYKADLFATVSGQLIGKRQGLEDALDALPEDATAEDVEAINWS